MNRLILAAGVAAMAIAGPALAERGGKGGGGPKGGSAAGVERGGGRQASATERGHGGGGALRADRGGRVEMFRAERRSPKGEMRFAAVRQERAKGLSAERGHGRSGLTRGERAPMHVRSNERIQQRIARGVEHGRAPRADEQHGIVVNRGIVRVRDWDEDGRWDRGFRTGFVEGCPPGLAKKHNGCLPPGQARKLIGAVIPATYRSNLLPLGLRDYWRDDDDYYYRVGDGYLYRVNRDNNLIASLLPLFGGGYGFGQPFPYSSPDYYVPSAYQPFFADSPNVDYRYNNGYVYAVDPMSGMIEDIVPLYDRGLGVGQMLPASYGYYNVPYPYRSWYPAGASDYSYRYAPGAIYQVDPQTSLITSIASLLAPGLAVGQPLPTGYGAYNVPYAYRDRYYDTPDSWYRYSNGYIYQVDPTTQLVSAIVQAIV